MGKISAAEINGAKLNIPSNISNLVEILTLGDNERITLGTIYRADSNQEQSFAIDLIREKFVPGETSTELKRITASEYQLKETRLWILGQPPVNEIPRQNLKILTRVAIELLKIDQKLQPHGFI